MPQVIGDGKMILYVLMKRSVKMVMKVQAVKAEKHHQTQMIEPE
jgi:hypothetical protein